MDILWFMAAGFVIAIAFFRRELLIDRASFHVIFTISLGLFLAAVGLTILKRDKLTLFPSLMNPLISLGLFVLMREGFVRWKKREPKDTFFNWSRGLAADRCFNIVYFTLGPFLLMLLYIGADLTGYDWR